MAETTDQIRHDIEVTRDRISDSINQIEHKLNVADRIRENPWPSIAIAFGAGVLLSQSGADAKAAQVTAVAGKETGSKLGAALDGVLASLVTSVSGAMQERIDAAVSELTSAIRGNSAESTPRSPRFDASTNAPESGEVETRAD
jgi:hypothetical protein